MSSLPHPDVSLRSNWRWWVCGLLLVATMINYMDRLVLNQTATLLMEKPEKGGLGFNKLGYGQLEGYFGVAFAVGALSMGFVVDRFGPRVVYPTVVALWSMAGFMTGFVRSFEELLICRIALGFFEAANWSCALKTTQAILHPKERTLGNGILQSGAAVGAILTPMLVLGFLSWGVFNGWRPAFWSVGALGLVWVGMWLIVVRPGALESYSVEANRSSSEKTSTLEAVLDVLRDQRFWVLAFTVVAINLTWHFFRWMPLFLEERHGFSRFAIQFVTMGYYLSTDLGSLVAGVVVLRLAGRGLSVRTSRLIVFGGCAVLTLLSIPVAYMPPGASSSVLTTSLLLGMLFILGFAALGLFPNYYSFTQDLTTRHQGKVTGMLGCACWLAMAPMQIGVGAYVEATGSYINAVALGGLPPLLALLVLVLFLKPASVPKLPEPAPAMNPGVPTDDRVTADVRAVQAAKG